MVITWTVYGKVSTVTSPTTTQTYVYDAAGNRVQKTVTVNGQANTTTHYVRDASGNVMAIYIDGELTEQAIYGSSRIGRYLGGAQAARDSLGRKQYEISNHLGNVMAVVSDRFTKDSLGYQAELLSAQDYYPFGLSMPGRSLANPDSYREGGDYRYGFNGKERDPEGLGGGGSTYDYGFRIYNPGIGKFLSVDPLMRSYPMLTPYQFASNRSIDGIDLDGLEYLRADEARIKMIGGGAHINLENFNNVTRNAWKMRDMQGNWPPGHIGWPTKVGELTHPSLPAYRDWLNLDNTYGANDPNYVTGQHKAQNPTAKSTGLPDRRYKERVVSGAPASARGAAGAILVSNAVMWGLEQYGIYQNNEDRALVNEHVSILRDQVAKDLNDALEAGMIPAKYQNIHDLGNISNVILSGVNPTGDKGIYDVGIEIVKKISKNFRDPALKKENWDATYDRVTREASDKGNWFKFFRGSGG